MAFKSQAACHSFLTVRRVPMVAGLGFDNPERHVSPPHALLAQGDLRLSKIDAPLQPDVEAGAIGSGGA